MKFMHKISRLFGIGTEADPKKNRLSINLTEVAPSLEQQSTPQSELSSPPEHLAFVEKVDTAANTRLVEPSNLVTQDDDIENLGPLTPSEVRIILEGTEATLGQFAASPRLFAKDAKGDTPLHIAARTGNLFQCDLFVRAGSNPATLNNEQQTPADVALGEGHRLVAQLLSSLLGKAQQQKALEGYQVSLEAIPYAAVLGEGGADTLATSDRPVSDNDDLSAPEGGATATWPDHRVQRLKALWAEGKSAGQIARELGGVSRNAVLSKLFRLGMLNKLRSGVDPTVDQQIPVDFDDRSNPPEKPSRAEPLLFNYFDEQRSNSTHRNTESRLNDGTFWTGERLEALRWMWIDGQSATEIARAFGGFLTPAAVLIELQNLGIHDRPRGKSRTIRSGPPLSLQEEETSLPIELAQGVTTSANLVQIEELDNLLHFEAEEEPEEFLDKAAKPAASGTFVPVLNSSPAVFDNQDTDWELDLSPASIAGEGIGSSNVALIRPSGDRDFLQVGSSGRRSVKKAVVQTSTRMSIDPELCIYWAEEILAKEQCSLDDIDRIVANCEGNGDLEELRVNLQRNLEAAGFNVDQVPRHDADLWASASDVSSDELADAIESALTRRTRLPGTQGFVMQRSEELQLLEPMMRAKQELQLGILASETAVNTILDVMDSIRNGSRDPGSVSLRTIIPSRPGHAETSEVMAAVLALGSWHSTGRVMDGKRRREALAALEALDLTLAFHKELVRRLEQFPACQAEANRLEAEILTLASATEHLIREHLPYVRRFASRNVEAGEDPEDVFQVAFMGLQRATRRFDPERGYRFLIYATYWMRQAIMRWRADEGGVIRIPVHRNEKITTLDRALDKLDVRVSSAVSDFELVKELEWTIDEVRPLRAIPRKAEYPASIDDWDNILPEPSEVDVFDQAEIERIVKEALAELPERQAEIIRMRFGIGRESDMTLEEIGRIYGVTRERIRQIEAKALNYLSHPARLRRLSALVGFERREKKIPQAVALTIQKKPNRKAPKEKRPSPWTEGRLNQLRQLWAEGMSSAEIAQNLGDISRNAVIGKLNRLGLSEAGR